MGKPPNQCDPTTIIESDTDLKNIALLKTSMPMSVDGMLGMVTSRPDVYLWTWVCQN